jgi:hypothetical protein
MTHLQRRHRRRSFTAAAVVATVALSTAVTSATADDPAATPPQISVLASSPDVAPGYVFLAPKRTTAPAGAQGPEIVDDQGRPVWFDALEGGDQALDFRVQRYHGKRVLTWWQGQSHTGAGHGEGTDYVLDQHYHVIATVTAGNGLDADQHEFRLTDRGTALITIYHAVPYDLTPYGGPADGQVFDGVIQEIDVATGHLLFEWHSLDHVPLSDSYQPVPSSPATPWDYFHINAVNPGRNGDLLISARHTWTVYDVNRTTGHVNWRLGGKHSDLALGDGVQFAWQHDPLAAGPHLVRLFDNGTNGSGPESQSRVEWIRIDTKNDTATLDHAFTHDPPVIAPSQGNTQALPNGDTLVGWGAAGRVSELSPTGELLWDAQVPAGYDDYRAYRDVWVGKPDTDPTLTAGAADDGTVTVHAVWNGATEVARWQILGGPSVDELAAVADTPWNGLDTAVAVRGTPAVIEAVALDAKGKVIGRSAPLAVSA